MADGSWSASGCRPDVWWYGYPGQGSYYWTQRWGQYWVSGGVHVKYGQVAYECGMLGAPVKAYGWISEFSTNGQWFEGGCIVWQDRDWKVKVGSFGQTAGRLVGSGPFKVNVNVEDEPADEPVDKPTMPKKGRSK